MKKLLAVFLMISLFVASSQGDLIAFEFDDTGASGVAFDGLHFATTVVAGVTLVGTADTAVGSVFNQTASGFGVNHTLGGDDTDTIDGGSGSSEFMTFTFNVAGMFTELDVDRYTAGGSDTLDVEFLGGPTLSFTAGVDSNPLQINAAYTAGQEITIRHTGGNGFGIEFITVDTIPEPSTLALLALAFGMLGLNRKLRA